MTAAANELVSVAVVSVKAALAGSVVETPTATIVNRNRAGTSKSEADLPPTPTARPLVNGRGCSISAPDLPQED